MTRKTAAGEFDLDMTMMDTYFGLRWAMVAMAVALPFILYPGGLLIHKCALQDSMSAYYWTPMTDWFVGILFGVAACLYLYKGLSDKENRLLNAAAAFAAGTAVNPVDWHPDWGFPGHRFYPHEICAVLFLLMIALACWLCQDDSLNLGLIPSSDRRTYRAKYAAIGSALVLLPLFAVVFRDVLAGPWIFFTEAMAIWVFAIYWYTKSGELKQASKVSLQRRRRVASRGEAACPP